MGLYLALPIAVSYTKAYAMIEFVLAITTSNSSPSRRSGAKLISVSSGVDCRRTLLVASGSKSNSNEVTSHNTQWAQSARDAADPTENSAKHSKCANHTHLIFPETSRNPAEVPVSEFQRLVAPPDGRGCLIWIGLPDDRARLAIRLCGEAVDGGMEVDDGVDDAVFPALRVSLERKLSPRRHGSSQRAVHRKMLSQHRLLHRLPPKADATPGYFAPNRRRKKAYPIGPASQASIGSVHRVLPASIVLRRDGQARCQQPGRESIKLLQTIAQLVTSFSWSRVRSIMLPSPECR